MHFGGTETEGIFGSDLYELLTLGGGFIFFKTLPGEMIQFDYYFSDGLKHQLGHLPINRKLSGTLIVSETSECGGTSGCLRG